MKQIRLILFSLLIPNVINAGLITRTYSYTSGNTIVANENNTNENTLYTEINGNIESANIKDGTIANADIADTTIDITKMNSVAQSSFTFHNTFISNVSIYKRPTLQYTSATQLTVTSNDASGAKILFPDGTQITQNNSLRQNVIVTQTAIYKSGTAQAGILVSTAIANTWYSVYAVKSQIDGTQYVVIASTVIAIPTNVTMLNNSFGSNAWVYLGMFRHGDGTSASTSVVKFYHSGNKTVFNNNLNANVQRSHGISLATSAGAASLTYTYTAGVTGAVIPSNVSVVDWIVQAGAAAGTSGVRLNVQDASSTWYYASISNDNVPVTVPVPNVVASDGVALIISGSPSVAYDVILSGYIDDTLGVGLNPQS